MRTILFPWDNDARFYREKNLVRYRDLGLSCKATSMCLKISSNGPSTKRKVSLR